MEGFALNIVFLILSLLLPMHASAQDGPEFLKLGGDLFGGGSAVVLTDAAAPARGRRERLGVLRPSGGAGRQAGLAGAQ